MNLDKLKTFAIFDEAVPVTVEDIDNFEKTNKCKLPEDYKKFLLEGFGGIYTPSPRQSNFYPLSEVCHFECIKEYNIDIRFPGDEDFHELTENISFVIVGWIGQGEEELVIFTSGPYAGTIGWFFDGVAIAVLGNETFSDIIDTDIIYTYVRRTQPEWQEWYHENFITDDPSGLLIARNPTNPPIDFEGPDLPEGFQI